MLKLLPTFVENLIKAIFLCSSFLSNSLFSSIGNVGGLPSGSNAFSNKLDLSNPKQDLFRSNKMQDLFPPHNRTSGFGNTSTAL